MAPALLVAPTVARAHCPGGAATASVLFADEPDAALDRAASHALFAMLAASDETFVAVTHDIDLARRYASHVIGLRADRIEFQRPATAVSIADCEVLWW